MVEPVQRFIQTPFAATGDKLAIPNALDPNGNVSYTEGFGFDYERDPTSDVNAKRVPRDSMNQLFNDLSTNIRQYQQAGYPQWVAAADNGGTQMPYPYGARVRFGGLVYASTVDNNVSTPGSSATWVIDDPFSFDLHKANLAETVGGVLDTKLITPLRFVQAVREAPFSYVNAAGSANALTADYTPPVQRLIAGLTLNVRATQTNTGNVTLNVNGLGAKAVLGVGNTQLPPNTLAAGAILTVAYNGTAWITTNLSRATKTSFGVTRYATEAEARTAADDATSMTPLVTAQAGQSGAWTYAAMGGSTAATYQATLSPAPSTVAAGLSMHFVAPVACAAGPTLSLNGDTPIPLQWQTGGTIAAGDIALGDMLHVVRTATAWRIVNVTAASTTHRGNVRLADAADIAAGTDGSAAVTAPLFRPGVLATVLTGLSTATNAAISAADSVLSAMGKLQAQINARGVLAGANTWLGTNVFAAAALYIRGAAANNKMLVMQDTDGTNRGMLYARGGTNILGLRTYSGGAQSGADLNFDGVRLTLNTDVNRRFINRTETASVEEVALMETWEKYVTPAALAGLQGVVIETDGTWTIFTIGGKMRVLSLVGSSRGTGNISYPANRGFTSVPVAMASVGGPGPSHTGQSGSVGATAYDTFVRVAVGDNVMTGGGNGGGSQGTQTLVAYNLYVIGRCD